jgi:hypothetical protein
VYRLLYVLPVFLFVPYSFLFVSLPLPAQDILGPEALFTCGKVWIFGERKLCRKCRFVSPEVRWYLFV